MTTLLDQLLASVASPKITVKLGTQPMFPGYTLIVTYGDAGITGIVIEKRTIDEYPISVLVLKQGDGSDL